MRHRRCRFEIHLPLRVAVREPQRDHVTPRVKPQPRIRWRDRILIQDPRSLRRRPLIEYPRAPFGKFEGHIDDLRFQRREVPLDLRPLLAIDLFATLRQVLFVRGDRFPVALELERAEPDVAEHFPALGKPVSLGELRQRIFVLRPIRIFEKDDTRRKRAFGLLARRRLAPPSATGPHDHKRPPDPTSRAHVFGAKSGCRRPFRQGRF
jgi:hypothetical protein